MRLLIVLLQIECLGATAVQLEKEKADAQKKHEEDQKKVREEAKKAGGGLLGGFVATVVVSAVADPAEPYDQVINIFKEDAEKMKAKTASEVCAPFLKVLQPAAGHCFCLVCMHTYV